MLFLSILIKGFSSVVIAGPLKQPAASIEKLAIVKLSKGTIISNCSGKYDICSYKGIPYALPPIDNLRLREPQAIGPSSTTFTATAMPSICPQMSGAFNISALPLSTIEIILASGLVQTIVGESEDCLTLNFYRPSSAQKPMPVVVWIYGGGFQTGSTNIYDPKSLILASVQKEKPVVYVSINYRMVLSASLSSRI